jgi:diacylglycerol kinase family enzyme
MSTGSMAAPRLKPPMGARSAAAVALLGVAGLVVTVIVALIHDAPYLLGAAACLLVGVPVAWAAATSRRARGVCWTIAIALGVGALVLLFVAGHSVVWLVVLLTEIVLTGWLGGRAMEWEVAAAVARRWRPVPRAQRGVLFMNPHSGGGKVDRFHLVDEARRRGIEAVMLSPGTDLRELAETAAASGADVIGMAGGDGSQATVASVAADHDLGFVCVPTGTRNHLALDLGVDRRDVVGALDAFGAARESRMDLGTVNGRVFVNNVSLGIYAEIVASEAYRDNKVRTVSNALPDLLGPGAPGFDLRVSAPDGTITDVHLVQVSNGPYAVERLGAIGSRPRLDSGRLGAIVLRLGGPADATAFIALEAAGRADRFPGWRAWTAQELRVDSSSAVAAGLDGEAVELDPPLLFAVRPSAVRVRTALHHPGVSPAARRPGIGRSTLIGLARILVGRPSGLIPDLVDASDRPS